MDETILMQIGPRVRGRLLMFDLGCFCYQTFACVEQNGGLYRAKEGGRDRVVS